MPLRLADGAMGTWFAELTGLPVSRCEHANLEAPDRILSIHKAYLDAGARYIRSNTFSASVPGLGLPLPEVLRIVRAGFRLAREACLRSGCEEALPVADLGPGYDPVDPDGAAADPAERRQETGAILEAFLEEGARAFHFETLADPGEADPALEWLERNAPGIPSVVSFAIRPDGRSRKGHPLETLLAEAARRPGVVGVGLNCGIGPGHLKALLPRIPDLPLQVSLMPNAGYPGQEGGRTVFAASPAYFAETAADCADILAGRSLLLGGCCGTTPRHIAALAARLAGTPRPPRRFFAVPAASTATAAHAPAPRAPGPRLRIAVELDPPPHADPTPVLDQARVLRDAGVDWITVADSPLSSARMDPVVLSARIQRETGIPCLPHLCCRDRNVNALRSLLLGAHAEGIRQVLCVTGDRIPEGQSGYAKPVFNVNSFGLLRMVREMNETVFPESPLLPAAAMNPSAANPDAERDRVLRKVEAGARLFLTQPIFSDRALPLLRRLKEDFPDIRILAGVLPLSGRRNALFLQNEVPGIVVPDEVVERFAPDLDRDAALETGLDLAMERMASLAGLADGFYLVPPFNRAGRVVSLLRRFREGAGGTWRDRTG